MILSLYVARVDADQIAKLSDGELQQYVEGIAGQIEIAEEDGEYAASVHFKTETTLPDGRRRLRWHQKSGLGGSRREAMEFLAVSIAQDEAD
jgi:hypothetical protein